MYPPNSAADFCVHAQVLGQDFSPKKADLVDPHGGSPGGCYPKATCRNLGTDKFSSSNCKNISKLGKSKMC